MSDDTTVPQLGRIEITEFASYDSVDDIPLTVIPNHGPVASFLVWHAGLGHEVERWNRDSGPNDNEQGAFCKTCGESFAVATVPQKTLHRNGEQ